MKSLEESDVSLEISTQAEPIEPRSRRQLPGQPVASAGDPPLENISYAVVENELEALVETDTHHGIQDEGLQGLSPD